MKNEKTFSVGIVTYNSECEIKKLLDSFERLENREDIEIFVVDNCSSDMTYDIVEANYPNVKLLKNKANLGFGKANNKIIRMIDSRYHVLVNPDITFSPDTFINIQKFMDTNQDIVQMTPKVLDEDGLEQFLPKKYPEFKYLIAGKLDGKIKMFSNLRAEYTLKNKKIKNSIDIDFCTGCFSVLRTEALKRCNGFDERYFLYFEDADLTREMQKYGRTVYNPNIEVFHKWKRESSKSIKYLLIHLQSMMKYYWKWRKKDVFSRNCSI